MPYQQSFSQLRPEYPGSSNNALANSLNVVQERVYKNRAGIDKIGEYFAELDLDEAYQASADNIKNDINGQIDAFLDQNSIADADNFIHNLTRNLVMGEEGEQIKKWTHNSEAFKGFDNALLSGDYNDLTKQYGFQVLRSELAKEEIINSNELASTLSRLPKQKDIKSTVLSYIKDFVKPNQIENIYNKLYFNEHNDVPLESLTLDPSILTNKFFSDLEVSDGTVEITYSDLENRLMNMIFGFSSEDRPDEFGDYLNTMGLYETELAFLNGENINVTGRDILKANLRGIQSGLEYKHTKHIETQTKLDKLLEFYNMGTEVPDPPNLRNDLISSPLDVKERLETKEGLPIVPNNYGSLVNEKDRTSALLGLSLAKRKDGTIQRDEDGNPIYDPENEEAINAINDFLNISIYDDLDESFKKLSSDLMSSKEDIQIEAMGHIVPLYYTMKAYHQTKKQAIEELNLNPDIFNDLNAPIGSSDKFYSLDPNRSLPREVVFSNIDSYFESYNDDLESVQESGHSLDLAIEAIDDLSSQNTESIQKGLDTLYSLGIFNSDVIKHIGAVSVFDRHPGTTTPSYENIGTLMSASNKVPQDKNKASVLNEIKSYLQVIKNINIKAEETELSTLESNNIDIYKYDDPKIITAATDNITTRMQNIYRNIKENKADASIPLLTQPVDVNNKPITDEIRNIFSQIEEGKNTIIFDGYTWLNGERAFSFKLGNKDGDLISNKRYFIEANSNEAISASEYTRNFDRLYSNQTYKEITDELSYLHRGGNSKILSMTSRSGQPLNYRISVVPNPNNSNDKEYIVTNINPYSKDKQGIEVLKYDMLKDVQQFIYGKFLNN